MPQLKTRNYAVDACQERPKHMLEVMRIIAAASFADHWLGNILIGLSPMKGVRLAKQFNALENDSKKAANFEGIAAALLEDDMHELLHRVVKLYKKTIKKRHPFAHQRYGWAKEDEDILLLIDPRHELLDRAVRGALQAQAPNGGVMPKEWWDELHAAGKKKEEGIMCYRLAELESIREEIEETTACLTQFWHLSGMKPPPPVRDVIQAELTQRLEAKGL